MLIKWIVIAVVVSYCVLFHLHCFVACLEQPYMSGGSYLCVYRNINIEAYKTGSTWSVKLSYGYVAIITGY